jgi:hypothetical protein
MSQKPGFVALLGVRNYDLENGRESSTALPNACEKFCLFAEISGCSIYV